MRRVLVIAGLALVALLSIPAIALWWLCYTESGLLWLAGRTEHLKNTKIEFTGLTGYLAGPIHAQRFVLDHPRVRIDARDVEAAVHLPDIWLQTVHVKRLQAAFVAVEVRRRPQAAERREPRFLPPWLRLRANELEALRAHLLLQNGMEFEAAPVRGRGTVTKDELAIQSVAAGSEKYSLSGALALRARDPLALQGELKWQVTLPEQPLYTGAVTFDGDLANVGFRGSMSEPFLVAVTGNAFDLTGDWNWKALARTEHVDLLPWQPESPLGGFVVEAQATGSRDVLNVTADITPKELATGALAVSLKGAYRKRQLRADELVVNLKDSGTELRGSGEFIFDGGIPSTRLDGRWTRVQWPLRGAPAITSPAGTFSIGGEMPFLFTLTGSLEGETVPDASFLLRGVLDKGRITAREFAANALAGTVSGNGEITWAPQDSWRADIEARDLDPRFLHATFPGRVAFRLAGAGEGFDSKGRWDLTLDSLRGRLREQPISGRARVRHMDRSYRISRADIQFGGARLIADGVYGPQRDLRVDLQASDLARVVPRARGSLTLRANLAGDDDSPHLKATLSASNLAYERYRLRQLQAEGDVDLSDRQRSSLRLEATGLGIEERRLRSLRAQLDGRASNHGFSIVVNAGNAQVDLHASGGYRKKEWQGLLDRLNFTAGDTRMAMTLPAKLTASRARVELGQVCLNGGAPRACGQGSWQVSGPWSIQAQATGLPLRALAAGLPRPLEYSGTLGVDVRASGRPGELWGGVARADFQDGVFRYRRANGKVQSVAIGTGRAQLTADAQRYAARINFRAQPSVRVRGEAQAGRRAGADWRDLPLKGSIDAQTRELGFIPVLVPEIDRASGQLDADLTLAGTLGAPRFDGSLVLTEGEMDLFAINLMLRDIGLQVDLAGNSLNLTANARAGDGNIGVTGDLSWEERLPQGTLRLKGENLLLVDVPEARIVASPSLRFRVDGRRIEADGAVRVPMARLSPANLTGAALPSEDEVIAGEEPVEPGSGFDVSTGIHLILGDEVTIDSYGLTGKIKGGVLVYSATGQVGTGIGEIKIEEGNYTFYGRELDIEYGRLIFSGGPLSNPGVDLRAVKEYPDVLAGVNVRGTLLEPRISFFSEPPLPQTQIVSILVAGRTLDSIQDAGPGGPGTSNAALLAQGGALLASRLGEQLGINLDELSVESQSAEDTSLVLGKYLSPRLYVSYGISLTESINTLKLRYTISDHWQIRTEAGEARSADVVFTIDR